MRWSFHVVRGVIASEVATAAAEVDVLILGKAARSLTGPRRLGSTVRMVLSQVTGPELASAVQVSGCGTLVVPAESPLLENEALLALLDKIGMPVLWVR